MQHNAHFSQSVEATLELEQLCRVSLNIISPENSRPVIGICQDSLVGGFLMTADDVRLTRAQFMQLMVRNSSYAYEMPAPGTDGLWSGKQAFSTILPELDASWGSGAKAVEIRDGRLMRGRVGKSQLGGTTGSLVHVLFNDYSPAECLRFLDNEQAVTNAWLLYKGGFSVGLSDCILPAAGRAAVRGVIRDKLAGAYQLLHQAHQDTMPLVFGKSPADDFELQITSALNGVRDATKTEDHIEPANRVLAMFLSKSKGNQRNLTQIMSCVGQQVVAVRQADGTFKQQRIPYNHGKIKGGFEGRTLPHFHKHDDSPKARGFVQHSYLEGLDPYEYFFHNASGREGLIDTAIKTADTGYLQRRLIKLMEDCKVHYDGTVRNAGRLVLQYSYGDDDLDSIKLEQDDSCQRLYAMSDAQLVAEFKMAAADDWTKVVDAKVRREIERDAGLEALLDADFRHLYEGRGLLRDAIFKMPVGKHSLMAKAADCIATYLPVNMPRLIASVKRQFRSRKVLSDMHPRYVVERVDALVDRLATGLAGARSDYMRNIRRADKVMYDIVFRAHLCPRQVLVRHRLTRDMFDFLLVAVETGFQKARVCYGEMVGVIAAQSLGQPTTQMTLNTFHNTGISMEFNVVDGVPRLEELFGASKNPKAPQITIYLRPEFATDEHRAGIVRNKLRSTRLRDICKKSEIVYDPSDDATLVAGDAAFLRSYHNFMRDVACGFDAAWVLRIELDRAKMLERNLRLWEVQARLEEKFGDEIQCVFSDDNHASLVARIRLGSDEGAGEDEDVIFLLKHFERSIMDGLVLRGVPGINNAVIPTRASRPCIVRVGDDGGVVEDGDTREVVIIADGSNGTGLMEVMKLPEVDTRRTTSNFVYEVYGILGVEAARNLLLREIFKVFQSGDSFINHRHIELLVDTMTCRGDLTPITRNGIQKLNVGPMARSGFETTEEQFYNAAAFAEVDNFQGVSANIMVGQTFKGGTGECEVVLDEERILASLHVPAVGDVPEPVARSDGASERARARATAQLELDFTPRVAAALPRFTVEGLAPPVLP